MPRLAASLFISGVMAAAYGALALVWAGRLAGRTLGRAGGALIIWICRGGSFVRNRISGPASLWGTTPILTIDALAKADRQLGLTSRSVVFSQYSIFNRFDRNHSRLDRALVPYPPLRDFFRRWQLLGALVRFDVFHLFFDNGFLPQDRTAGFSREEITLLRRAGKTVYLYAYGSDVRTRKIARSAGEPNACSLCPAPGVHCICHEAGREHIAGLARQEGVTARAMLDMIDHVPGAEYFHHWPVDQQELIPDPRPRGPTLRIVHASNHPEFKGSQRLVDAIDSLRAERRDIELISIRNKPRTEALELVRSADIVADQFLIGAYGYFALESMALGKPVMVFMRWPDRIRALDSCPLILTDPDNIRGALMAALEGKLDLEGRGQAGPAYIARHHSIARIAMDLGESYVEAAAFPDSQLRRVSKQLDQLRQELADLPEPEWSDEWDEETRRRGS